MRPYNYSIWINQLNPHWRPRRFPSRGKNFWFIHQLLENKNNDIQQHFFQPSGKRGWKVKTCNAKNSMTRQVIKPFFFSLKYSCCYHWAWNYMLYIYINIHALYTHALYIYKYKIRRHEKQKWKDKIFVKGTNESGIKMKYIPCKQERILGS